MAGHCPDMESNLNLDKIPLKSTNSLNCDARFKSPAVDTDGPRFQKNFFSACERPNTALDFTAHHKTTSDFTPLKQQFRPQTSAGVRPGSGHAPRAHHVSKMAAAPPGVQRPARKIYKRAKARQRIYPRVVKSRELRAGCLHVGCDCVKLNGLQDDCRRRECGTWHGNPNPECAVPECGPSVFGNARHLQALVDAATKLRNSRQPPPRCDPEEMA